jgi:hypothetical protein
MYIVYLILFLIPLAVVPWLVGRGLGRWSPGLRHLPWLLQTATGGGWFFHSLGLDSGSSTLSEITDFLSVALGAALFLSGLMAGVLIWRFPGTHLYRLGPSHPTSSNPGHPSDTRTERPETFALLRHSLEPDLPVQALIQATRSVPSIQEADCRMVFPRAGILFRNLPKQQAIRLRAGLNAQGVPVHLVEESRIAPLPQARRAQALRLEARTLVETDQMGRTHRYPLQRIQWCGAGRLEDAVYREHEHMKTRIVHTMGGHAKMEVYREIERGMEELTSLHFDVLLSMEPWRILWTCDEHQRRMLQGRPVGPVDQAPFEEFLRNLRGCIPADRLSPGIRNLDRTPLWIYPSLKTFENEIRWFQTCRKLDGKEATP